MEKLITLLTAILLTFAPLSAQNQSIAADELLSEISYSDIYSGNVYSGYLDVDHEKVWYRMLLPSDGKIDIAATPLGDLQINRISIFIAVEDTLYRRNISWFDPGDVNTITDKGIKAGTYYISVPRWSGAGNFQLTITHTPVGHEDAEPNDTFKNATTVANGSVSEGHLGYEFWGDMDIYDWYTFTTTTDGEVSFSIQTDTFELARVGLYNIMRDSFDVERRNLSYDSGKEVEYTQTGLKAGKYFLRVTHESGCGSYTMTTTIKPDSLGNDIEPNDILSKADSIVLGSRKTGHMGYYYYASAEDLDEEDWFTFTTPEDGEATFDFASEVTLNRVQIYTEDSTYRNLSSNSGKNFSYTKYDLKKGNYWLRIPRYSGWGEYSITTQFKPAASSNDEEPNDLYSSALILPEDKTLSGHLGYWYNDEDSIDDTDWYKISVRNDGDITFKAKTNEEMKIDYLRLYASVGDTIERRNSSSSGGTDISFTANTLTAEIYYLEVERRSWQGSYTISFTTYPNKLPNDAEPNNNFHEADSLTDHSVVTGHLGYYPVTYTERDEQDWYLIPIGNSLSGTFTFITDSTLEIDNIELFAKNGDSIRYLEKGPWGQTFTYSPTVTASGSYYLKVARWSGYGGYTLGINVNADSLITSNGDIVTILPLNLKVAPNPATFQAQITYNLPEEAMVSINLVSLDGKVIPLVNERQAAGNQELMINTSTLDAGTYLLSLKVGKQVTSTILIVR